MIWQFISCRYNSRSGRMSFTSTRETSMFIVGPSECLPTMSAYQYYAVQAIGRPLETRIRKAAESGGGDETGPRFCTASLCALHGRARAWHRELLPGNH